MEILELMHAFFPERRGVRVVDPRWWMGWVHPALKWVSFGRFRRLLETPEVYVRYFLGNPRFDVSETQRRLRDSRIGAPSVESYFGRLLHRDGLGGGARGGRRTLRPA